MKKINSENNVGPSCTAQLSSVVGNKVIDFIVYNTENATWPTDRCFKRKRDNVLEQHFTVMHEISCCVPWIIYVLVFQTMVRVPTTRTPAICYGYVALLKIEIYGGQAMYA